MSETKFTPGPWKADDNDIETAAGELLATAYAMDRDRLEGRDFYETAQHNAHLIAAAPDLYEALDNLAMAAEFQIALGDKAWIEMHGVAKAALAKARGEA